MNDTSLRTFNTIVTVTAEDLADNRLTPDMQANCVTAFVNRNRMPFGIVSEYVLSDSSALLVAAPAVLASCRLPSRYCRTLTCGVAASFPY